MTPRDEVVLRGGDDARAARSAAWSFVRAAAIASAAVFAGGGLLTQTVLVPYWRALEPAASLTSFVTLGRAAGATLFPIALLAVVLLGVVVYATVRAGEPGRFVWIAALLCMVATFVLLPLYFVGANDELASRTIADTEVAGKLRSWYVWNWARTGLAFLAVVLGCLGLSYRVTERIGRS